MSQVSVPNEVMAAMQQFSESFEAAQASTGSIPRPLDGEHNCRVVDIRIDVANQTIKSKQDSSVHPAFKAEFFYQILGDAPPDWDAKQIFPGKTVVLPIKGWSSIPGDDNKGTRSQARIETNRFKGILKAILGDQFTGNAPADMQAAFAKVKDKGRVVAVKILCQRQKDQKDATKTYFNEYGVRSLDA